MRTYERGEGRHHVRLDILPMGPDLCMAVYGGDQAHIGAVAMAVPRPSLDDAKRNSATASVLAGVGHKEDLLARKVALDMAAALGVTVSVSCGVHLDDATAEEIAGVGRGVDEMIAEAVSDLNR